MVLFGSDVTEPQLTNVKIRTASPADATRLTEIAHDAKRYWGYPEHWIRHWQDDLTISPGYLEANQVFLAEREDQIVGFYALIMGEEKAELDHLWVSPDHMGTGVGKELFIHAMQRAAGQNVSKVEILSDPNAEGFYQKMGAHKIGESVSEIEGQPRVLPRLTVHPETS